MAAVPKKTDPRVVVRLSPEDHQKLKELAEGTGEPLATFMRNAALKVRQEHREVVEAVQSGAQMRVEAGSMVPKPAAPDLGRPFKCRVPGCEFAAGSSKAFCPNHPGPLLPV